MTSAFLLPELQADKGRVTQGCPALSSEQRVLRDYRHRQRIKQDGMVREANVKKEQLTAPDGNVPTTVLEAQLGRALTSAQIKQRLLKLNPNLIFERSVADPSTMGIYIPNPRVHGGKQFLLGFEFGYSPEFTVNGMRDGRYQETRGWRQIIVRLAKSGHISLGQAEVVFDIAKGRGSKNYQTLTS